MKRLLIIQAAALGANLFRGDRQLPFGLKLRTTQPVFPAVTCTAQASFRTASTPARHGMVANGLYFHRLSKPMFWEQSSRLVEGERIWEDFRRRGRTVGMMFWQQSLGEDVDLLLSPAPIHKHHGGMIQDCYTKPAGLYDILCDRIGKKFNLMRYWGPLASAKVGDWIASATAAVLEDAKLAPHLLLTYLPSMDYDLQRHGPDHPKTRKALDITLSQIERLAETADECGYEVLLWGDYTIVGCDGPVLPNLSLREAELMSARDVKGMLYPDFHQSRGFAVVDHEVAHVYIPDAGDVDPAREVLSGLDGVAEVLGPEQLTEAGLDHPNAGQLVLVAEEGSWFAYPWWTEKSQQPDFATHVDIHNKPGFDPAELFFGWPPGGIARDLSKIRGSHGRAGEGRDVVWASTIDLGSPEDVIGLAGAVKKWLDE
ncbi:MAG: alkaline phosphatase family protein [Phycisphaerae bacterium]